MKTNHLKAHGATGPTVFVTKGRHRVKQYNEDTVFLKNGDEFEIELFNPTPNKVLAKIKLNGKYLSSGIVLRPGERVFLERYLDEAKKFLFETYGVDGSDPDVREAIRNNGEVEAEFYREYVPYSYTTVNYPTTSPWPNDWRYYDSGSYRCSTGTKGFPGSSGGISCGSASYYSNVSNTCFDQTIETGRVEKGSDSHQTFDLDSTSFESHYTWRQAWKILPESQRPFVKEDLKVFCTGCGARRKKASHQFCPNCGNRF